MLHMLMLENEAEAGARLRAGGMTVTELPRRRREPPNVTEEIRRNETTGGDAARALWHAVPCEAVGGGRSVCEGAAGVRVWCIALCCVLL